MNKKQILDLPDYAIKEIARLEEIAKEKDRKIIDLTDLVDEIASGEHEGYEMRVCQDYLDNNNIND